MTTTATRAPAALSMRTHAAGRDVVSHRWMLAGIWAFSAAYSFFYAFRGWVPHDEGTLAQTAERVLLGELPHRDFVDVYTGGLTFLHALAFRLLGINLVAPRVVLLVSTLAWIPVVYWLASRFCRPQKAGGLTLLALLWGPPNYFASLPSWYNLFFATFAGAALLRFTHGRGARWLLAAGSCAGLSLLAKLTGVFLVAAGLLYLTYLWADDDAALPKDGVPPPPTPRAVHTPAAGFYASALAAGLVAFLLLLLISMRSLLRAPVLYHLYLPVVAVTGWVLWRVWNSRADTFQARVPGLLRLLATFLGGVALPLVPFVLPYAVGGGVGDLVRGVFVLPFRRLVFASALPPPVGVSALAVLPVAALLGLPALRQVRPALLAAAAAAALLLPAFSNAAYRLMFIAAAGSVPVVAGAGVALLVRHQRRMPADGAVRRRATLLLLLLVLCGLVQFPYATPIYFCYVAPLEVLALASVLALRQDPPRAALWALGGFAGTFAAVWLNTCIAGSLGGRYVAKHDSALLPLPRGGIRVSARDSLVYAQLTRVVQARARGRFIYAGPDAAQVYFLTGKLNPTRDYYDFFDDPGRHERSTLSALATHDVDLIVVNTHPAFSAPLSRSLLASLQGQYPQAVTVGQFIVARRP